jgi:phage shock protein C
MTASSDLNQGPAFSDGPSRPAARPFFRSRTNRVFAGVCGGIAEHFSADPFAVRLLTALIAVFTGVFPVLFLYLFAAIFLPVKVDGETGGGGAAGVAVSPGQAGLLMGLLLVAIGCLALANEIFRIDWALLWPLALVGLGAALVVGAQRR